MSAGGNGCRSSRSGPYCPVGPVQVYVPATINDWHAVLQVQSTKNWERRTGDAAADVKKNWGTWRPIYHARGSLFCQSGGWRRISLRAAVCPPRASGTAGAKKSESSRFFLTGRKSESQDCASPYGDCARRSAPLRRQESLRCTRGLPLRGLGRLAPEVSHLSRFS